MERSTPLLVTLGILAVLGSTTRSDASNSPSARAVEAPSPDSAEIYYDRDDFRGVARIVPADTTQGARRLLLLGWSLYKMNRIEEALSAFDLGLRVAPSDRRLRLGKAYALYRLGTRNLAAELFQELLGEEADDRDARFGLALVLFTGRRYEEALPHFEQLVRIHPDEPALREYLRKCVDGHLSRMREDGGALSELGRSGWRFASDGFPLTAFEIFSWVIERDPFHPSARLGLGTVGPIVGRNEEARAALESLLAEDPRDLSAGLALARLEKAEGKRSQAEMRLEQILARQPDHAEAKKLLRELHHFREVETP